MIVIFYDPLLYELEVGEDKRLFIRVCSATDSGRGTTAVSLSMSDLPFLHRSSDRGDPERETAF